MTVQGEYLQATSRYRYHGPTLKRTCRAFDQHVSHSLMIFFALTVRKFLDFPIVVDVNGHLGTVTSSARFKEAIKPMGKASEAILSLQPVTFRYKKELDPDGIPQFGLVAEDVEKVNPALVARDADGKPYTVRYEAVNAMLLNEFLKEHRKVEQLTK